MSRPLLRDDALDRGITAALMTGRFQYRHSGRIECTHCGRSGWRRGLWAEACLLGHPYVCACGRVFSTRQGIATHRRRKWPQCVTNISQAAGGIAPS